MDLFSCSFSSLLLLIVLLAKSKGVWSATFTFVNKCDYTVWPGILANAGSPPLGSTGFELPKDSSRSFLAPTGWSGRFWARTACKFDGSESGACLTGDCGSGQVECNGLGAAPPATLAEFTLGTGGQDFYDVSLVDGYNLPMIVESTGGSGVCGTTGCLTDVNRQCPAELRVGQGDACKSACEAFGSPEYCCSGAFNTPSTCKPSVYSQMFKSACPKSYSYAYDDATSTFTCSGADYTVTFCPSSSSPSQKSSNYETPPVTGATPGPGEQQQQPQQQPGPGIDYSGSGYPSPVGGSGYPNPAGGSGYPNPAGGSGYPSPVSGSGYPSPIGGSGYPNAGSGIQTGSGAASGGQSMMADGSYLAGLAMGDSQRSASFGSLLYFLVASTMVSLMLSYFHL